MAVVALGLGLWALSLAAAQREFLCAANPAELEGVWDDRTRAAMTDAFEKSGGEGHPAVECGFDVQPEPGTEK